MRLSWFDKTSSIVYAVLLHLLLLGLLGFSIEFSPTPIKPPKNVRSVMNATSIDKTQVESEIEKLKNLDQQKKRKEQERKQQLEQQAKAAEQKRKQEEQQLKKLKEQKVKEQKQAEQAKKQREAEALRIKQEQEAAEKKRIEEEKKIAEAEAERKRIEAEKKKAEEEKRKKQEELKRLEEERKQREQEDALQRALDEEAEAELAAEQAAADASLKDKIAYELYSKIVRNFNRSGMDPELNCDLRIQLAPGGDVISVNVIRSSGNEVFDNRATNAVKKASPFTVIPSDIEQFERMDLREINLKFEPEG